MPLRVLCLIAAALILTSLAAAAPLDYPPARTEQVSDYYHGTTVADPYRWLEDIGSDEVKAWWGEQNKLSFGYLNSIPGRDRMLERMKSLVNYRRWNAPGRTAGRYFYYRNDGLQNQTPLYVTDDLSEEGRILLDPNDWEAEASALGSHDISEDGRLMLYAKYASGSDWTSIHVLDIDSGKHLPDVVKWAKFGIAAWNSDASGYFYLRFPEPAAGDQFTGMNLNPAVWFHQLGTGQEADRELLSLPEHPDWWLSSGVNEDRDMLLYYVAQRGSINNMYYVQKLTPPGSPVVRLLDANDANYGFVTNTGDTLYFHTNRDAPNSKLVAIDLANPELENWRTVIPERAEVLTGVSTVGGFLFAHYSKDTLARVEKYDIQGNLLTVVNLPGDGSAYGFGGRREDTETFYTYTDFTTPSTVYRYDLATDTSTVWRAADFPVDTSRYVSRLHFFRARDGLAVPVFLLHRRGLEPTGSSPTILYGYGGFSGTQAPYFSSSRLTWLDMGGVYAIAGIRGGEEYGRQWHESAIKTSKQVSFNDFIDAGQWLIDSGWTDSAHLAIQGGSNGGLLVTAVELQRPDLFSVVLAQVPVTDMLRFNQFTAGKGWESDYGSPVNPAEFAALYAYSPYHNVRPGVCYPATLITTGDTDDRVVPAHSFKFAARLQAAQGCEKPVLLRVEASAGHGAGKPLDKSLAEIADIYAFTLQNMGLSVPESFD